MDSYENRLAAWKLNHRDEDDLRCAIKAYHWATELGDGAPAAGVLLAKTVWPAVLEHLASRIDYTDLEYDLISTLLITQGWRHLFDGHDTASAFVVRATRYIELGAHSNAMLAEAIGIRFIRAVSGWLEPGTYNASLREIAAALFGEVWCALIYDARGEDDSLAALIEATNPEFIPGRLTSRYENYAVDLPDMSG